MSNTHKTTENPSAQTHLVILCYHHINQKHAGPYSISADSFIKQLDYLRQEGYRFVSLKNIEDYYTQEKKFPEKAVAITFDDGNRSVFTEAYPILKAQGIPFAVFIYPIAIEHGHKRGFMTWAQISALAKDPNVIIGSHSYWHPYLTNHNKQTYPDEWLQKQICESKKVIEKKISRPVNYFAVPYGVWDKTVYDKLIKAKYKLVVNVNQSNNDSRSDPHNLNRLVVYSYEDLQTFKTNISKKTLQIKNEFPANLSYVTANAVQLKFTINNTNISTKSISVYEYHAGRLHPKLLTNNVYSGNILLNKKGFYLVKVEAKDTNGILYCGSWNFFRK